ncbi:MAG: tetratricopeptide repeat protein [Bryobacteraceae bacterium]|nr:tetratricopeptide repeat protein [Bryobacteraceae bacterium]
MNIAGNRDALRVAVALFSLSLSACRDSAEDALTRANELFDQGKFADASLAYRQALQKNPSLSEARYRLGLAYARQKKFDAAYDSLRAAVQTMPGRAEPAEALANLLLPGFWNNKNRPAPVYDELQKLADRLLALDSASFTGHRVKGYLALADSRADLAATHFRKALERQPADADSAAMLAQSVSAAGRTQEAIEFARSFLRRNPSASILYDVLYGEFRRAGRGAEAEAILTSKQNQFPSDLEVRLQLASHFLANRKTPQFNESIAAIENDRAQWPHTRLRLGRFFEENGNLQEAFRQYQLCTASDPEDRPRCRRRQIALLITAREFARAGALLQAALKDDPDDYELKLTSAVLRLDAQPDALPAVTAELQALAKERDTDPRPLFHLGRAFLSQGRANQAADSFQAALQRDRAYLEPRYALASLAISRRSFQQALRLANEALAIQPDSSIAVLYRIAALRGLGSFDEARTELNFFRQNNPNSPLPQIELAYLYLFEGKHAAAEDIFQRVYQGGDSSVRVVAGMAEALTAQRKYKPAIQFLEADVARNGQRAIVLIALAESLLGDNQIDRARPHFEKAAALDPTLTLAHDRLAAYRLNAGDAAGALELVRTARKATNEPTALRDTEARALAALGRTAEVETLYRAWLAEQPRDPRPRNDLAYLLASSRRNLDEAEKLARSAASLAHKDPAVADTLGFVLLQAGRHADALEIYQRLPSAAAKDPVILHHHAQALAALKRRDQARTLWKRALTLDPPPDFRSQIEAALR